MKILVTNDDGIKAEGIRALVKSLKEIAEIIVIAPLEEKSVSGHGLTIHKPVTVIPYNWGEGIKAWAVDGTPADCCRLGLEVILNTKPDLIVSGINNGGNLGTDCIYSGTISAAMEGIILGIPSIAISLANDFFISFKDYTVSANIVKNICKRGLYKQYCNEYLYNINVPPVEEANINGIKITELVGIRKFKNQYEKIKNTPYNCRYNFVGEYIPTTKVDEKYDEVAIKNGYVSITPISYDISNHSMIDKLRCEFAENLWQVM